MRIWPVCEGVNFREKINQPLDLESRGFVNVPMVRLDNVFLMNLLILNVITSNLGIVVAYNRLSNRAG